MTETVALLHAHLRGEHHDTRDEVCPACSRLAPTNDSRERDRARKGPRTGFLTPCECGCGALVARRFAPGHDAKLKSRLHRELKSLDSEIRIAAKLELERRGW